MYPLINEKLRETQHKVSIVVTGGGASCIDNILKYGGASSTLIDSYVPYDTKSMDNYLGYEPNKYCSKETSCELAMEAFKRGSGISDPNWTLGVGVTCKLAKISNERDGREHAIYIAIQGLTSCKTYTIIIGPTAKTERNQSLGRIAEEALAGDVIVMAIADAFGNREYGTMLEDTFGDDITISTAIESNQIGSLYLGDTPHVFHKKDKKMGSCIFSGSFNPIHEAHLNMISVAKKYYGSVDVEISIVNADKGAINYSDLIQRIEKIDRHIRSGLINNLILTVYPTFYLKTEAFIDTPFILGGDTFNRLDEGRFYDPDPKIAELKKQVLFDTMDRVHGASFLVFKRKDVEPSVNSDLLLDMCTFVEDDEYIDCGISSTQIREEAKQKQGN